jgi:plastocyanin
MRTLLISLLLANVASAGTITGTVRAAGRGGADEAAGGGGKYESRKFKFAERVDYSALRDFVVYIEGPVGEKPEPPQTPLQIVVQKDAQFAPHVLPVVVGTKVEWPNRDEIFHNAFSMSDAKQFDLGLYKEKAKIVEFDKPGRVDVFCSIHTTMHCIVLVLENSFFALTDAHGRYAIANVPAGTYRLKAWHERVPAQIHEVVVPESGEVKADFSLTIAGLPEY